MSAQPATDTTSARKKRTGQLNKLSWAFAAFAFLAFALGAADVGRLLIGIAVLLAIGAHLGRRKKEVP